MKKIIKKLLVTSAIFFNINATAFAADSWGIAAQALGLYAAYRSALSSMLEIGEDVNAQIQTMRMDFKENGKDTNPDDNKKVNDIMTKLIEKGDYALRPNSLPFLWGVNNSQKFNASCYPTDYISINKGLLRVLEKDDAALAAVFAHEMIHGLMQHSANSYAEAIVGIMGAGLVSMHADSLDWDRLNGSVGYGIAKNVILPAEIEADEKGFYLMTSAGFHPGGGAMAMARMRYYLQYETKDIFELTGDEKDNKRVSDHPETIDRENKLSALMTEYSINHVTVKDSDKVYVDGNLIYTAKNTGAGYDNRPELAYGVAGGLAKAFHDYKTFVEWNFNGNSWLNNDSAYNTLKKEIRPQNIVSIIKKSYDTEDTSKRVELKAKEAKRHEETLKTINAAKTVKEGNADKYRWRCDAYSDYLMGDYALKEAKRAKEAVNQKNMAECLVMEGRAYAAKGDYATAVSLATKGISMDSKNEYNFLNRADIYYMQGNLEKAIPDARAAINANAKNAVSYKVLGNLLESKGDLKGAIEAYKQGYNVDNEISVPFYMLKEINKKEYERRIKARQDAEKKLAEEFNERHKKERSK